MLCKQNRAWAPKLASHSLKPFKFAFTLESNAVYETRKVGQRVLSFQNKHLEIPPFSIQYKHIKGNVVGNIK